MSRNEKEDEPVAMKATQEKLPPFEVKLGFGGWDISYPGVGTKTYGFGDIIKLNPHKEQELRAILQIIREVNRKKTNRYLRINDKKTGETEQVYRFTVLSGLDTLPELLQKYSYTASGGYTDEEIEAIKNICPTFAFEKKKKIMELE